MKRYTICLFILAQITTTVLNVCLTPKIANNNVIGGDEGYSERNGNHITYYWNCIINGDTTPFQLELYLAEDFDIMQYMFKQMDHSHIYPPKVLHDPFKLTIRSVANELERQAANRGCSAVTLALSFVQALPYQSGMGSYQRFASETLVDRMGDCSDCSVLFAALVMAMNVDCVFLEYPMHLMVGVWCDANQPGTYYTNRGRRYYMCETTGWGWSIGNNAGNYLDATLIEL